MAEWRFLRGWSDAELAHRLQAARSLTRNFDDNEDGMTLERGWSRHHSTALIARETPGGYFINQFGNPDNPAAHEEGTGPEIWEQMDGQLDAIVFGCGSSGTMTGLSRCFAQH